MIYEPGVYKEHSVYKGGGIEGFEFLDKLYLGSSFSYGTGANYFTNKLAFTITNEYEIISKFYTKPNDHLGGNVNYIFALNSTNYGSSTPSYFGSVLVGANIQHDNLNIKNGGSTYTLQRDRIGGDHELHFINGSVFFDGFELPVQFNKVNLNTVFYFPETHNGNPVDEMTGERPGESMAMTSLEIISPDGKRIVNCRPARRIYDNKIGPLDLSRCVFWDNGNFYDDPNN